MQQARSLRRLSVVFSVLSCAVALGCVTRPASDVGPEIRPLTEETEGAAAYMRGRLLEQQGHLEEAADAYEIAAERDPASAHLQKSLAQIWVRLREPDRALEHARRATELDPSDAAARRGLLQLLLSLQHFDEAIAMLETKLASEEVSDDDLFRLVQLLIQGGRADRAVEVARRGLERQPDELRWHLALGLAHEQLGKPEEAERVYREALALDPASGKLFDALARLRRAKEDVEGERKILAQKLRALPGDPGALLRLAQMDEESGARDRAIARLEELTAAHPDVALAQLQLGYLYLQEDRHADALVRLTRVAREPASAEGAPLQEEARYLIAVVHQEGGDGPAALDVLGGIGPAAPRYVEARILESRIHEESKDTAAALAALDKALTALAQDPARAAETVRIRVHRAGLLQRGGDVEQAVAIMRSLLEENAADPQIWYDLGVIYGEAGREAEAVDAMNEVLGREPDHAGALNYIGYTWAEQGIRLDEAEQMIRRAADLEPDDGYITDSLGWVYYQRGLQLVAGGKAAEAREAFGKAIEQLERAASLVEEPDPIITWHLGDAYRSVSRFDDALRAYRRALDLEPKEEDAQEILRQIELLELQRGGKSSGATR